EYGLVGILTGGTADIQNILKNIEHRVTQALNEAFNAIIPPNMFIVVVGILEPNEEYLRRGRAWRNIVSNHLQRRALANLQADVDQSDIHNQALGAKQPRIWENFRFRSESEIR